MSRILLIEDDQDLSFVVATVLESAGHVFACAETSNKGLAQQAEHKYDMIVLDNRSAQINAQDFFAALRRRGDETPIVMLNEKPFDVDKLLTDITKCSSGR